MYLSEYLFLTRNVLAAAPDYYFAFPRSATHFLNCRFAEYRRSVFLAASHCGLSHILFENSNLKMIIEKGTQ